MVADEGKHERRGPGNGCLAVGMHDRAEREGDRDPDGTRVHKAVPVAVEDRLPEEGQHTRDEADRDDKQAPLSPARVRARTRRRHRLVDHRGSISRTTAACEGQASGVEPGADRIPTGG